MLFKKHSIEHGKSYLFSIATLTGLLLIFLSAVSYMNAGRLTQNSQTVVFMIGVTFAGTIFTSLSFNELSDKRKAVSYLTLPASQFEKYLVAWLYSYVIFQLVFLICFYAMDFLVVILSTKDSNDPNKVLDLFEANRKPYIVAFIFLFFHSFVFLGSIIFKKAHFVKIAFTFFVLVAAFSLLNKFIISSMINENKLSVFVPFSGVGFVEKGKYYNIDYLTPLYLGLMLLFAIVGLLWLSAFYKLKEKEV
nr:hypothetical protein [Pseudopedobacter sp.]